MKEYFKKMWIPFAIVLGSLFVTVYVVDARWIGGDGYLFEPAPRPIEDDYDIPLQRQKLDMRKAAQENQNKSSTSASHTSKPKSTQSSKPKSYTATSKKPGTNTNTGTSTNNKTGKVGYKLVDYFGIHHGMKERSYTWYLPSGTYHLEVQVFAEGKNHPVQYYIVPAGKSPSQTHVAYWTGSESKRDYSPDQYLQAGKYQIVLKCGYGKATDCRANIYLMKKY